MTWPIVVVAVVLCAAHLIAPALFRLRQRFEPRPSSLAGGMAVAYIFVHLLPEVDVAHHNIGKGIYLLTLIGFGVFYGLEHTLYVLEDESERSRFALRLTAGAVYNGTVVYTLGEQLPTSAVLGSLYVFGLSMHVIAMDHGLQENFGRRFHRIGLPVLVLSIAAGAALAIATELDPLFVDISTAMLAGFIMFNVFREELPSTKSTRYPWFITGALLVVAIWASRLPH